jgi:mRNA interferase MazF
LVTVKGWVPDVGDVVWLHFSPQMGHEQAGHRPAVVLSDAYYNRRRGMMICVPMSTKAKDYPFEVPIAGSVPSVALADQVKNMDWIARGATAKGRVSEAELDEIRGKIAALIGV